LESSGQLGGLLQYVVAGLDQGLQLLLQVVLLRDGGLQFKVRRRQLFRLDMCRVYTNIFDNRRATEAGY
jgi:hypothetical protein